MSASASMRSGNTGAADGPPSIRFTDATKQLAKTYYPFIYVDKRRLSKPVVDLQAALEVCSDSLDEFERIIAEINSMQYAIYGLEQGLFRAVSELIIIREEIVDLMNSLKDSERFNLRLFDQLASLDKNMKSGIDSAHASLGKAKSIRNGLNYNIDRYRVPKSTKEALEGTLCSPEPVTKASGSMSNLITGQIQDDTKLSWLTKIQRELSHRHSEFSFLLIGLWTEGVFENHELISNEPSSCFSKGRHSKNSGDNENRELLLAHKGKIDDTQATLGSIQTKVQEIGSRIFEELGRLKKICDDTKMQHRDMTAELYERRRQLVESLLATHSAVQTLLELDEQNDALVGKLIKTRPLFAELHQALVRGDLDAPDGPEIGNFQLLPDVLGPDGWSQLLDNLQTVRVHPANNSNQNAMVEEDMSFFSNKFLNHAKRNFRLIKKSAIQQKII